MKNPDQNRDIVRSQPAVLNCVYRPEPRSAVSLAECFTLLIFVVSPPHRVIRYRNVIYDETKAPKMER